MKKRFHKERTPSAFESKVQTLSSADSECLALFFADFETHCFLPKAEKTKLRADFQNAFLYYFSIGVPAEAAAQRLAISNLGGFYSRPPILWYSLDDAAKIYPLSMKRGKMAVFRLSVSFCEVVVPELLQMALTFTIKRFPSFATTVKKGFFWHYLDTAKRRFSVEADTGFICKPLKIASSGSQSFRVLYYRNRVSVEFFHILTDGTGGMVFLKTLAGEYLRLCGYEQQYTQGVLGPNEISSGAEVQNAFSLSEKTESRSGFIDKPAVQMSGTLSSARPFRVLHFKMDASQLQSAAKSRNATVTAYLLAQLFLAGRYATDEPTGEMSIQVPVNMRKFFPSATLRNFSLYCGIRLPVSSLTCARDLIPEITNQLLEKASGEAMQKMLSSTQSMVNTMRFIPLFIKAPVARLVYGFLGDKIFSNTLSNLGVVPLPPSIAAHITDMSFTLGTALTNRASCSLVTCMDTATLTISKMTADPSFEEKLFELLSADGISLCAEGSEPYES